MKIRRINFIGGPGCGKSTLASYTYSKMKQEGRHVEFVPEFIKPYAYEGIKFNGFDQVYLFAQQMRQEDMYLRNGVDIVVNECPLFLTLVYDKIGICNELLKLMNKFEKHYVSLNILVGRDMKYLSNGRYETLDEAKEIDDNILSFLYYYGITYTTIKSTDRKTLDKLLKGITKCLKKN